MFRSSVLLLIILLATAGGLGMVWVKNAFIGWTYAWQQRITVTVDTPSGRAVGSAVQQVEATYWPAPALPMNPLAYEGRGQAVAVDLGPGGVLLAAVPGPQLTEHLLAGLRGEGMTPGEHFRAIQAESGAPPRPFQITRLPAVFVFTDPHDPDSLIELDPGDLAKSLGSGYALVSSTIEITDDPVTEDLASYLPWWRPDYPRNGWRVTGDACGTCTGQDDSRLVEFRYLAIGR